MRSAGFHQRDKRARRHQRAVGLAPAHQHFGAAQLAGADVDDRLIVRNELAGIERLLDLGEGVARRAARDQRDERRKGNHDDAGTHKSDPFEVGVFGGNTGTRRQDFDVKTEFVRFDAGDKIRPRLPARPVADLPDDRALPRHDTRIAAERAALRRHLREKQCRRHQCCNTIRPGANLTAEPDHALATRQYNDVERVAGRTNQ